MYIWEGDNEQLQEVHEVVIPHLGHMPICKGDYHYLPKAVQGLIAKWVRLINQLIFNIDNLGICL